MKRVIKSSTEFDNWYHLLSSYEQGRVDDIAEHNCIDIDDASDTALDYVKRLYKSMIEDEEANTDTSYLVDQLTAWADGRTKKFKKFEHGMLYFEKHSIEDMIKNYIRYFNRNIRDYGNGYEADWDDDDWMTILYKDGRIREVNPQVDEGTKFISIDNIDSIILNGSWGTAIAGPHIKFEDYTVYDDVPDIRAEFDI